MNQPKVALIGGGPSCLMAAYVLSEYCEVDLYEQGKTIGRKFLVAGKGGFNLTNSAKDETLLAAYSQDPILLDALKAFDSKATREWLAALGISTYIGSSGRVFPEEGIKPIKVLNQLKKHLKLRGVCFHTHSRFIGFDSENKPLIKTAKNQFSLSANAVFFGLGGGSWKKTGSNDEWLNSFRKIGVNVFHFEASNCGIEVDLPELFFSDFEGSPLKNIAIRIGNKSQKGELLITNYGIEGNAIYPLIPEIRKSLKKDKKTTLYLDLKPNNSAEELVKKVENHSIKPKNYKYTFRLNKIEIQLLKMVLSKEDYLNPIKVAESLKSISINVQKLRSVEESISTVGGIPISELDSDFSLKEYPQIKLIGEMLNWDAPTGGFLLQACFSTGYFAAASFLKQHGLA